MAFPSLPAEVKKRILELKTAGWSNRRIARELNVSPGSVDNHARHAPAPNHPPRPPAGDGCPPSVFDHTIAPPLECPDPYRQEYKPYVIDRPGAWLVLSDVHIPYHDRAAVEAAVAEGVRRNVAGVLLNGDIFDFYQCSRFSRDPSKPRIKQEIETGKSFLAWLRQRFARAQIVFKEGNHDERFRRYMADRAPDVFDLESLDLRSLSGADGYGVDWVADKRVVRLGKLPVVHGHEFAGGGGVSPSRWLFLRTSESALCGHFHQTSDYSFRRPLSGGQQKLWSAGCLCWLHPEYRPLNQWGHGFAVVDVATDGGYQVHNLTVMNGKVV